MDNLIRKKCYALCLLSAVMLAGCVDLSGTRATSEKEAVIPVKPQDKKGPVAKNRVKRSGEVHTMLGGLGIFSTGMNQLRDSVAREYAIPASSSMWYDAGHVTRNIAHYYFTHKQHRPIILVGHSLGANEQIKVARNLNRMGIPVDLLVTVDAVSQTIVPPNVKHAMNFYKSGYVPMFSGLRLRAVDPSATRIDNINVAALKGVNVNHFTIDKHPVVQAMILDRVDKVSRHGNKEQE